MITDEITEIRQRINRKMIQRTNLAGICYLTLTLYALQKGWWLALPVLCWMVAERISDLKVHLYLKEQINSRVDF